MINIFLEKSITSLFKNNKERNNIIQPFFNEINNEIVNDNKKMKDHYNNLYNKTIQRKYKKLYEDYSNFIEKYNSIFITNYNELKNISLLNNNDKLIFDNYGNISIDKYDFSQFIRRWYNNQHRDLIYKYLPLKFNNYSIFLKNIIEFLNKNTNLNNYNLFKQFIFKIIDFNKLLIEGLTKLINTYNNDKKLTLLLKTIKYKLYVNNSYIENNKFIQK